MRRLMIGIVAIGIALTVGVSQAQESGPPMPEKLRVFMDRVAGTWTFDDGSAQGTVEVRWDPAAGVLVDTGQFREGDVSGSWSGIWYWDGVSDDGLIVSWSSQSSRGFSYGQIRGKVLSETTMEGQRTGVRRGKSATAKIRLEFKNPGRYLWHGTDVTLGDKSEPDYTEVYTKVKADDEQELIRLQNEWLSANVRGDVAAVGRLLTDDYVLGTPDGTFITKAELLSFIESYTPELSSMKAEDLKVQIYGNTALVRGLIKWSDRSGQTKQFVFTDTWMKRGGRWQCRATHESGEREIATPPSPEMKKLSIFVGDWTYEGEQVDPPVDGLPYGPAGKYTGTITTRPILGGHFLETTSEDRNPGGVMRAHQVLGYDPKKKQYVVNAFLSDGSRQTTVQTPSSDGRTWTIESNTTSKEGKTILLRSTIKFSADGTERTDTVDVSPDGGKTWKFWCRDTSRKVNKP